MYVQQAHDHLCKKLNSIFKVKFEMFSKCKFKIQKSMSMSETKRKYGIERVHPKSISRGVKHKSVHFGISLHF